MFINSQPSSINFQQRIVERSAMTRTQKNLYDDYVKDHVYSESFTRVSHKLDDYGMDVRVRGIDNEAIIVQLEKKGEPLMDPRGRKISQILEPRMIIRQLEDKFLGFKERCLSQLEREKKQCVDEIGSDTEIFPDFLDYDEM